MSKAIQKQLLLTIALAFITAACCTWTWQIAFGETQTNPALTIRYVGSDGSQISGADLFSSSEAMMPGDHQSATLTVKNDSSDSCNVWLRSGIQTTSDQPSDTLSQAARLSISDAKGNTIYRGDLSGSELGTSRSLGSVEAGGTYTLVFDLEIPAELDNDYALSQAGCGWVITVTQEEAQSSSSSTTQTAAPRTGDSATMVAVCIISVALSSLAIIISRNRIKRKER